MVLYLPRIISTIGCLILVVGGTVVLVTVRTCIGFYGLVVPRPVVHMLIDTCIFLLIEGTV